MTGALRSDIASRVEHIPLFSTFRVIVFGSTHQPDSMQLHFSRWWCAEYVANDKLGKVLASIAMLPYFVILHTASRCYSRREVHEVVSLVGLVANEALARLLKHLLKHPRPEERCELLDTCESYGMPSSHTQCMFFALVLHAAMFARHARQRSATSTMIGMLELACMLAAAMAVAYSRVYLKYHSLDQVAIGAVLGMAHGAVWMGIMAALAPVYAMLADSQLGQLLHIKDTWNAPEPLETERAAFAGISKSSKAKSKLQ